VSAPTDGGERGLCALETVLVDTFDLAWRRPFALARTHEATARTFHSPGTPLRACAPRSVNSMPDPATRSRTVLVTKISPGPASAATRAPMCKLWMFDHLPSRRPTSAGPSRATDQDGLTRACDWSATGRARPCPGFVPPHRSAGCAFRSHARKKVGASITR
jgi:hypothetical protein